VYLLRGAPGEVEYGGARATANTQAPTPTVGSAGPRLSIKVTLLCGATFMSGWPGERSREGDPTLLGARVHV